MQVRVLRIENFRGIAKGQVEFLGHTLLVGGNNCGKSTICEALDLVLGPERLFRRPVVNEHDFHRGQYMDEEGNPVPIRIKAILVDLSEEAQRRFGGHVRPWSVNEKKFVDETGEGPQATDRAGVCWALPIVFLGQYDSVEDDFQGDTFFAHPEREVDPEEEASIKLGAGLGRFTREHKRLCGFVFLRALRTGSRALSLQRGSLLDTILRLGEGGLNEMWLNTLQRLRDLEPPIGEIDQLREVQAEIRKRMMRFVTLARGEDATAFFASDLTRDHLREVVRFFIASELSEFPLPFQRMGTGTVNVLVFALLTFIAELKQHRSVIFAMEEPEIALPPHTQRRVAQFVLGEMGQAIVSSHSPYIIEQFEPQAIVMLNRSLDGKLCGIPVDTQNIKPKTFKTQRRQFAEAVLSRAVLVVEGATETVVFPAVSAALEKALGQTSYEHLDLTGVTIFDAGTDALVPSYGPVFKSLGKKAFAFYDRRQTALSEEDRLHMQDYELQWESPFKGIEELLVHEIPISALRRFLEDAKSRQDYPHVKRYEALMVDEDVRELAKQVLIARKGGAHGYGDLLIEHCRGDGELPNTLKEILLKIHQLLKPPDQERGTSATDDSSDLPDADEIPVDQDNEGG